MPSLSVDATAKALAYYTTLSNTSLLSCPLLFRLLNFDNTIQALDESPARKGRAGEGAAQLESHGVY